MVPNAIVKILEDLQNTLVPIIGYPVYSEIAPDQANYPFVTASFGSTDPDSESMELIYLDLDGFDSATDAGGTMRLETMMQEIIETLEQRIVGNGNASFQYFLDNRKSIREPDVSIRRRRQTYVIRSIGKE